MAGFSEDFVGVRVFGFWLFLLTMGSGLFGYWVRVGLVKQGLHTPCSHSASLVAHLPLFPKLSLLTNQIELAFYKTGTPQFSHVRLREPIWLQLQGERR